MQPSPRLHHWTWSFLSSSSSKLLLSYWHMIVHFFIGFLYSFIYCGFITLFHSSLVFCTLLGCTLFIKDFRIVFSSLYLVHCKNVVPSIIYGINAGSQSDARPCIALIHETHKFTPKKSRGSLTTKRNAGEHKDRIQVYPSVILRFYKRRCEDDAMQRIV